MAAAVGVIASLMDGDARAGSIAGIHLEGPFLNPAKRGSHHRDHLLAPSRSGLRHLLDAGAGQVRVVTLAPELPGGLDLVHDAVARGVIAAVGHTDASYDEAQSAFAAGARLATHLFNGMRQFHHRDPGPAGAALANDNVVCELINDGFHVHDEAIRVAVNAAGPERIAFITDATPAAGMTDGEFRLGPVPVFARDGQVRLADGTFAGSTLTMDATVRHAVRCVGLSLVDVAIATATTPATLLGLGERTGSLRPGKDADLVVLSDQLTVETVVSRGTVVHGSLGGA
jgi:N-acetylglucosamine-6-phosphate deacetylase